MRPHAELRMNAAALGPEVGRIGEQRSREDTVGDDLLIVVDVVDEPVQSDEALDETALHPRPLVGLDDAGDDVERPRPIDAGAVGVDGEGDAHGEDVGGGRGLAGTQLLDTQAIDDLEHVDRRRPRRAVVVAQLVPGRRNPHVRHVRRRLGDLVFPAHEVRRWEDSCRSSRESVAFWACPLPTAGREHAQIASWHNSHPVRPGGQGASARWRASLRRR